MESKHKEYDVLYHQTSKKSKKSIEANGFNSSEVWLAPDDTAFYGKSTIKVNAPKPKNPFVMDVDSSLQYGIPIKQINANKKYYDSLGNEASRKTFDTLRKDGYDVIIEDNGDRAYLYPNELIIHL